VHSRNALRCDRPTERLIDPYPERVTYFVAQTDDILRLMRCR
jgi:hypothetical protein